MPSLKFARVEIVSVVLLLACQSGEGRPPVEPEPNEATRRLVWRTDGPHTTSAPAVDESAVYVASIDHTVIAVEKEKGALLWQRRLPVAGEYAIQAVVRAEACVLVPAWDLWCLDPATGDTRWRFTRDTVRTGGFIPAVAEGVIYTGAGGSLHAIDPATGEPRWSTWFGANIYSPLVRDGVVYVAMSRTTERSVAGSVAAVDAADGQVRWQQDLPVSDPSITSATVHPVIAGSVLVASSEDSHLYAFDLADGKLRWTSPRATPPGKPDSAVTRDMRLMATDGNLVFAGSALGTVSAYSAVDGTHRWTSATLLRASAFYVGYDAGRVYAVDMGFQLNVFDAATGRNVWNCQAYDLSPERTAFGLAPGFDATALYLGGTSVFRFTKE